MAWSEVGNTEGNSNSSEIKYAKLAVGRTRIRMISEEPFSRWSHWIPQANEGKGTSINCPGKGCPICKDISENKKNKTKSKYSSSKSHASNIYVKEHFLNGTITNIGEVQILDKGNKIYGALYEIMQQVGDLRNIDVNITRKGEKLGEIEYTILPCYPPTELTASEKAECEKTYDLQNLKANLTIEQIQVLMAGGKINYDTTPVEEVTSTTSSLGVDFTQAI